jgi:hypothetical protein
MTRTIALVGACGHGQRPLPPRLRFAAGHTLTTLVSADLAATAALLGVRSPWTARAQVTTKPRARPRRTRSVRRRLGRKRGRHRRRPPRQLDGSNASVSLRRRPIVNGARNSAAREPGNSLNSLDITNLLGVPLVVPPPQGPPSAAQSTPACCSAACTNRATSRPSALSPTRPTIENARSPRPIQPCTYRVAIGAGTNTPSRSTPPRAPMEHMKPPAGSYPSPHSARPLWRDAITASLCAPRSRWPPGTNEASSSLSRLCGR